MWANQLACRLKTGLAGPPGDGCWRLGPQQLRPPQQTPEVFGWAPASLAVPVGGVPLGVFTGGMQCGRHNGPRHRGDATDELSNRLLGEEVPLKDHEVQSVFTSHKQNRTKMSVRNGEREALHLRPSCR